MTSGTDGIFDPPRTQAGRGRRRRKLIGLVAISAVVIAGTVFAAVRLFDACGSLGSGVHRVDGECVGVTDGTYLFNPEFKDIQQKIADENARVRRQGRYVSIALLDPLTPTNTSALSADQIRNQLEGAFTAQYRVNHSSIVGDSSPQIQLLLANEGSSQGQWKPVVDQLGGMTNQNNPLVAVVGMGVSLSQTQQAAVELSRRKIPMVGSIITADGLDYNHIQGLIRVSPSNEDYVRSLRIYLGGRSDVHTGVLVYDSNSDSGVDIFTKTLRDDFEHEMRDLIGNSAPLSFTGVSIPTDANPGMFAPLRANICSVKPDVIFYAGRQLDLAGFLQSLENRICRNLPLTVMTGGTNLAALVRSQEEQLRAAKLTVVFSGTTDAQGWANIVPGTPDGYQGFLSAFTGQKLDPAHLDDGGAIMTHDAVLTAAEAVQLAAPGGRIPVAEDVRNQLMNLNGEYRVPGASGTLSFSFRERGAGNPEGKVVPIFQFPRPPGHPSGQIGSLYHTP